MLVAAPGAEVVAWYRHPGLPVYADVLAGIRRTNSDGLATDAEILTVGGYAGAGLYLPVLPFANLRAGGRVGYGSTTLTQGDATASQGALGWEVLGGLDIPLFGQFALTVQGGVSAHVNTYIAYEAALGVIWSPGQVVERTPGERQPRERAPREPKPEPLVAEQSVPVEEPPPEEDVSNDVVPASVEPVLVMTQTVEETGENLQLLDAGFATVFPVFYRFYADNPIGAAVLRNDSRREITDIKVSINIPRFLDLPQQQQLPATTLAAGEEMKFDLSVLFNDDLLRVTEGTRVAAAIEVEYSERGSKTSYSVSTILDVANRNAMTWDDTRKAASFVTAKDPAVLTFAKQVASIVRTGGRSVVNTNLRTGMAMLEAMDLYGISYVIDPTTPYAELSDNAQAIDFLQFPTQTFAYGAGDCDDLSICYTSNLEAVGIPAAFVTIPGHIYAAFDTGVPEAEIASTFPRLDDVIAFNGTGWIPVEVTVLDKGFIEAWKIGAREWRENASRDQAELVPIQTAWQAFEPIGIDSAERVAIEAPDEASLLRAYLVQLEVYVADAIQPQVARLQGRINADGGSAREYNRLGVVYAKYEMIEQARSWFQKAADAGPYPDAFLNMGHLDFMKEDYIGALDSYEEARRLAPDDPKVLLAEARAHHELENYGFAVSYYDRLKETNPGLADQFGYLQFRGQDYGRASDVALMKSVIIWGEEEE